jgi:glucose/arabinose dehydrogenase
MRTRITPIFLSVALLVPLDRVPAHAPGSCTRDNGLALPEGFCATVVATRLSGLRQIAVAPSGDIYAALQDGGVVALRDANDDGRADQSKAVFDGGGTGIAVHEGHLWFAQNDKLLRWRLTPGELVPSGAPDVVVEGLPTGGHTAKTFAFLGGDTLIVNIGSGSNSCQFADRAHRSPGKDPCPELEGRAGLWRFSTARLHQRQRDGVRYATGLRNAMALAVEPATGRLYAAPHGRDQLAQNWGFTDEQSAELPSEEFMQVDSGDDFGWPYCYYDWQQKLLVLAPEYGGDGKAVGRCSAKKNPLVAFPGHWAPMAIAFYSGTQFPAKYRGGAFIAFHGSWNRAPLPQQGFRVDFIPFSAAGRPTGEYETFATSTKGPTGLRPAGVAIGPDGSLYIGDQSSGTIWRVMVL